MINGISIPVLTPFKFYPAERTLGNGVNFQNVDNTDQFTQDWEGVYPRRWVQPVARFWNDYSYAIDFQVKLDTTLLDYADLRASIIAVDDTTQIVPLSKDSFFDWDVAGDVVQVRFYASHLYNIDDGCYRIKLWENGGDDIYYSEIINIADTHEDCYPLEYSNFENDFGLIFENASAETWAGKILIPLRMYKPVTREERETYINDVGSITTLRTIQKRIYEIESYPVSTWFAEKIKMIFGCSDLELNKLSINTEESVSIEAISESDNMEIIGDIQLNDFSDEYTQEEKIGTPTELITAWSRVVDGWGEFTTTGKDIDAANALTFSSAQTNSISIVSGQWYLIEFTTADNDTLTNVELSIDSQVFELDNTGKNTYMFLSTTTGSDTLVLEAGTGTDFECVCSMKKIS